MSQSVSSKPKDSKSDLSPMSALHTAISIREDENKANKADFLDLPALYVILFALTQMTQLPIIKWGSSICNARAFGKRVLPHSI